MEIQRENGRQDVLLKPPPAHVAAAGQNAKITTSLEKLPEMEQLLAIYFQEIQAQRVKVSELADYCRSVSSICLSLARMLIDNGLGNERDEVVIPLWLHQKMLGAAITVGPNEKGDIMVRLRDEGPERIAPIQ